MQERSVVDTSRLGPKRGPRSAPKGRQVDARALEEVRSLLGSLPRRRDLLVGLIHEYEAIAA